MKGREHDCCCRNVSQGLAVHSVKYVVMFVAGAAVFDLGFRFVRCAFCRRFECGVALSFHVTRMSSLSRIATIQSKS